MCQHFKPRPEGGARDRKIKLSAILMDDLAVTDKRLVFITEGRAVMSKCCQVEDTGSAPCHRRLLPFSPPSQRKGRGLRYVSNCVSSARTSGVSCLAALAASAMARRYGPFLFLSKRD